MEITNKYNLPQGIYRALSRFHYEPDPSRFSVTQLIGPPLIRSLLIKHWSDIKQDASDMLWLLLGKAIHYVLEHSGSEGQKEIKLEWPVEICSQKVTVVGVVDRICDGVLEDYKITSVWSFMKGVKIEWEQQLNVYAFLLKETKGVKVEKLFINAILRDWQTGREYEKDYPPIPFQRMKVKLWTPTQARAFIIEKLRDHITNSMRECTPEEKWQKPDTFAVMKGTRKRALRVLESYEEAVQWMKANGSKGLRIDVRPGSCVRCENYCIVNSFCPFWKEKKNG